MPDSSGVLEACNIWFLNPYCLWRTLFIINVSSSNPTSFHTLTAPRCCQAKAYVGPGETHLIFGIRKIGRMEDGKGEKFPSAVAVLGSTGFWKISRGIKHSQPVATWRSLLPTVSSVVKQKPVLGEGKRARFLRMRKGGRMEDGKSEKFPSAVAVLGFTGFWKISRGIKHSQPVATWRSLLPTVSSVVKQKPMSGQGKRI